MQTNLTRTTNGMKALKTTFNANVDLFGIIGSSRGQNITGKFMKAFREDANLAVRNLLWVRDVRGGAGERDTFRNLLVHLANNGEIETVSRVLVKVPEVGRWDDLFKLIGIDPQLDDLIGETVAQALYDKNGLAAKWMPREGKKHSRFFMNQFGLTERQYRKLIVSLSKTVEQQMCAQQWNKIEFGKIPSMAAKIYQRAFKRNAPDLYQEYVDGLATGKTKINAGAIFPYDVIKGMNGVNGVADAQWKALPDYLEGSTENLIPIIDVSYSMSDLASKNLTCMDVAVSLGMYVAERSKGIFKDQFITFHERPELVDLSGCKTLTERVYKTRNARWGGSTNLQATFELILNSAVRHRVSPSDMPTKIILFSDMQFNQVDGKFVSREASALEMIDQMYAQAGYKRPDIIFWNMNAKYGNLPVSHSAGGTAIVTGFSPAVMKAILAQQEVPEVTPLSTMLATLMVDRYNW